MPSKDRPIDVEEIEDETPDAPAAWEATQAPDVDPQLLLQQMTTMLQAYQRQGLVIQRADGSFMIPGAENPLQAEVDKIGSLCTCRQCTEYNQLHWRCVTCYQIYEWSGPQKPVAGWPLGTTGHGGMVYHAVCSQNCGQAFLARKRMRPGMAIPAAARAGANQSIGDAQVDFFLSGADA